MASSRPIEEYVKDIVKHVQGYEFTNLVKVHETLQRMRNSMKSRHELNYWKVLQCLGELSCDKFLGVIITNETISCRCHTYSNLFALMQLFVETQTNCAVIKRQLQHKDQLIPVLFKALRQKEDPALTRLTLVSMYRLLIVGKDSVVSVYMKEGLLRELYQQLKCRMHLYGPNPVEAATYCAKILYCMAVVGTEKTYRMIKNSKAVKTLKLYNESLTQSKPNCVEEISDWHIELEDIFDDYNVAKEECEEWRQKVKLSEELGQYDFDCEEVTFCSAPSCRKLNEGSSSQKFHYCGACKLSRYCSANCQREHWKQGHKEMCLGTSQLDLSLPKKCSHK